MSGPPERAIAALDGAIPVALLPVRIETRFGADLRSLAIRVFPDQVHLDAHEPELTEAEAEVARAYWVRRWSSIRDPELAAAAWDEAATRLQPGRARYVVDATRPSNLHAAGDAAGPLLPDLPRRASAWTRATEAVALPERWVAIGYQRATDGNLEEVFRSWSDPVPDRLATGPSPSDRDAPGPASDPDLPHVQDALRWAVDPVAAREAGMLLTVADRDLPAGRRLADGLARLLVLGVDWTLGPDAGADSLESLLRGHAATGDLAFAAPGTPTNNTGSGESGFTTAPARQRAEWAPPVDGDATDGEDGQAPDGDRLPDGEGQAGGGAAAGRLARALGISRAALAVVPGAGDGHHRWSSALVGSLWEATAGYYLSELLDSLGDDDLAADLRAHATRHLHAIGPLPTLRVGPQPYGVLPVVARSAYKPDPDDRAGRAIARTCDRLRASWARLTDRVPRLGATGPGGIDGVVLELLQRTPVPWRLRWREAVSPSYWSSSNWLDRLRAYQAPLTRAVLGLQGVGPEACPRLESLVLSEAAHPLDVPLVLKGDAGTGYLTEIAALALGGRDGRRELNLRRDSVALLEALLAFAACQELDKAATQTLLDRLGPDMAKAAGLTRRGVRTPELVRVEGPDPDRPRLAFGSARELEATVLPGTAVQVHDEVAARLEGRSVGEIGADRAGPAHGLARYLEAVDMLADAPPDELEWTFRSVLDLYSTRLDAWIASLADAHLARHRARRPDGVHIGCFGWVEELAPPPREAGESLGHIVTPSLGHAVSAAILRGGRESHRDSGAFDIDLSSRRVREGSRLLEGVAAGQSIAALVGYRIERGLRDAGLAELTLPLRLEAPLQARDHERDTPLESIAARDVVDGVSLLELFAGDRWDAVAAGIGVDGGRRRRLDAVLADAARGYDAAADLLFAETVHQTAAGNLERAGAAAAALDRQERPVEPEVARTPHTGPVVTNRVLVALGETDPAVDWPARGVRGTVEPRLDRWLGSVLGSPHELVVSGTLVRAPADGAEPATVALGSVSAADLGLSPLALVLAALRPGADRPSELEARVAASLAARAPDRDEGDRVELEDVTLLGTLSGWAARLVAGARALTAADFALPGVGDSDPPGAIDLDDLRTRAEAAVEELGSIAAELADAGGGDAPALRAALERASELAGGEALPGAVAGGVSETEALRARADGLRERLEAALGRAREALAGATVPARDTDGSAEAAAPEDVAGQLLAAIRIALGDHQPVLPLHSLARPAELAASLADRAAVLDGDETAPIAWLHRAALVRPDLDQLCGLLTHAEAAGTDVASQLVVAQLPHEPGARWCALPFGDGEPPPTGTAGHVVVAPDGFDPAAPLAGLAVDAWAEAIPDREHTGGVAFHYDAPGARPPQAIVLAVHPHPDPKRWQLDLLVETVNETADLARLRSLSLAEVDGFAGVVPALYLPTNYTRDVPSVSPKDLIARAEAMGLLDDRPATGVTGKD
jgi:hypothetical protein